jgi:SAM-dependent methyltransferase
VKARDLYSGVFSRHAAAYRERQLQIVTSRGRLRAIELMAPRAGERVLDLACGPGNVSRRLVDQDLRVTGVDIAPGMLELARTDVPEAAFVRGDLEQLPFADGSFDAAICGHGYQFVADPLRALRDARRVLRLDGRLAASVPADRRLVNAEEIVGPIADRWLPPRPTPVDAGDRSWLEDPGKFVAMLRDAGFREARGELLATTSSWESPGSYVSLCSSWWDTAARMEGVPRARIDAFQAELREELEARFGPGPFETPGQDVVVCAVR